MPASDLDVSSLITPLKRTSYNQPF